MLYNL